MMRPPLTLKEDTAGVVNVLMIVKSKDVDLRIDKACCCGTYRLLHRTPFDLAIKVSVDKPCSNGSSSRGSNPCGNGSS